MADSLRLPNLGDLKPENFKRFCGVNQGRFNCMVSGLPEQLDQKKQKPGKPSKLSLADQVSNELGVLA